MGYQAIKILTMIDEERGRGRKRGQRKRGTEKEREESREVEGEREGHNRKKQRDCETKLLKGRETDRKNHTDRSRIQRNR